ncbi:MAG TPA: hypothetical protein VFM77_14330 [Terriglobales bacterium]|nr:hypothetical protein [Terriglobales bacterium]
MGSKKALLLLAVGFSALCSTYCQGQSEWSVVQQLTSGQVVKIVLKEGGSRRGSFESANDSGVVIRSGESEQTLARDQVKRISIKGKGHRGRNALIGAGIGAGAGLGAGAAIDNDCSKNSIVCTGNKGKAILTPVFGLLGAGIGALIPSGGWHEIYRSR